MILFLRMIMHIVVSPKGNKRKKILKKRDELEGIYITYNYPLRVYIHSATSFASIIISHCGSLMKSDQSVIFVMYGIASFLFLVDLMCFLIFFISSFGIVEQSLTYLCIFGGLYSRPSIHSQLSKNKTCKNFAATNRWPFNQVVFCFYIQPCIISIYMCISHP